MSAARHLRTAPTEAETLADEIAEVCRQIDRRTGAPPGTALRGLYWHLWPPADQPAEVLTQLHADAVAYLHDIATKAAVITTANRRKELT